MADFNTAYNITLGHEGGYDNDPDDVGGETYKGIARKYYPEWKGWIIIDSMKCDCAFPNNLQSNGELNSLIRNFYRINYWNLFCGNEIPDQQLANELFDTGVNMGVGRAVKYLQQGLNLLNRNQKNYSDIVDDGSLGNSTMKALNSYLALDAVSYLYKIINILQGMHYIEYAHKSPTQEKYMRGWLDRVDFIKK